MDNVLLFLGLMKRAKALATGSEDALDAARNGRARMLAYAADAAENTVAGLRSVLGDGGTPLVPLPYSKAELGHVVAKGTCAVFAVTDTGMARALCEKLDLLDEAMLLDRQLQRERRRKEKKKNRAGSSPLTGAAGRIAAKKTGTAHTDKRGK